MRGINFEDFIKSPDFIFSDANIYFISSPIATSAILDVLHPSNMMSTTLSICGGPSVGPSRVNFSQ